MQTGLFDQSGIDCEEIVLPSQSDDGSVEPDQKLFLYRQVFVEKSDEWLQQLLENAPWQQDSIHIAGQLRKIPRLQVWYGNQGAHYQYSGLALAPQPWSPLMLSIKQEVEALTGRVFNSALLNLYRDGNDSVSWHADDEKELGPRPIIASLSLGESRQFCLKEKNNLKNGLYITTSKKAEKKPLLKLNLEHASLLVMGAGVQPHWLHALPKQPYVTAPRVNITFRSVK